MRIKAAPQETVGESISTCAAHITYPYITAAPQVDPAAFSQGKWAHAMAFAWLACSARPSKFFLPDSTACANDLVLVDLANRRTETPITAPDISGLIVAAGCGSHTPVYSRFLLPVVSLQGAKPHDGPM